MLRLYRIVMLSAPCTCALHLLVEPLSLWTTRASVGCLEIFAKGPSQPSQLVTSCFREPGSFTKSPTPLLPALVIFSSIQLISRSVIPDFNTRRGFTRVLSAIGERPDDDNRPTVTRALIISRQQSIALQLGIMYDRTNTREASIYRDVPVWEPDNQTASRECKTSCRKGHPAYVRMRYWSRVRRDQYL